MSTINSVTGASTLPPSAASQSSNPSQNLSQADFLKLLVTQMTSQDPLDPQTDTAMAAQMAQFSALQSSQNTETDLQSLRANALIGQTVQLTTTSSTQSGVVSGVQIQSGTPEIVVNGQTYDLSQLSAIVPTAAAPSN